MASGRAFLACQGLKRRQESWTRRPLPIACRLAWKQVGDRGAGGRCCSNLSMRRRADLSARSAASNARSASDTCLSSGAISTRASLGQFRRHGTTPSGSPFRCQPGFRPCHPLSVISHPSPSLLRQGRCGGDTAAHLAGPPVSRARSHTRGRPQVDHRRHGWCEGPRMVDAVAGPVRSAVGSLL